MFGGVGEILVAQQMDSGLELYRMKEDGSGRDRVVDGLIFSLADVSWDGYWVLVEETLSATEEKSWSTVLYPVAGGPPQLVCYDCRAEWGPLGKFLYLSFWSWGKAQINQTFAFPLEEGKVLPDLPETGIRSEAEALDVAGVRVITPGGVSPGPDPSRYALTKSSVHRNLFRVPIP